jgi:hypothetical protein
METMMNRLLLTIKKGLAVTRSAQKALHEDERGDNENLGRLLILALVLIPLVLLVAFFGDNMYKEAKCQWDNVFGQGTTGTGKANVALKDC